MAWFVKVTYQSGKESAIEVASQTLAENYRMAISAGMGSPGAMHVTVEGVSGTLVVDPEHVAGVQAYALSE